jgi:hypothetical protein
MPMINRFAAVGSGSWIRVAEHGILRVVSLAFSLASAYAIRVFFAPLDAADPGEKVITWVIAAGFGVLGYVVSRGLVHRMMQKESIWAYAPICFLVELVDISCNYVLAASVVREAWWLNAVPENQRGVLTAITYVVLSAIPLVSLFLAVVDMDLERSKHGGAGGSGRPLVAQKQPQAPLRPLIQPKAPSAAVPARANQAASAPNGPGGSNGAAAKRASYWAGQPTQSNQSMQGKSGNAAPVPSAYDADRDLIPVH